MGARNCQELGINLQKICSRLLNNDNLIKLLYYTDLEPLAQENLTMEEKQQKIFGNLLCVVPRAGTREDSRSVIVVYVPKESKLGINKEFKHVTIAIDILVPLH